MSRSFLISCLVLWSGIALSLTAHEAKAEQLGIGVPYVPASIQLSGDSGDYVQELILRQLAVYPFRFKHEALSPEKLLRRSTHGAAELVFSYPNDFPIHYREKLSARTLQESIDFLAREGEYQSAPAISQITAREEGDTFTLTLEIAQGAEQVLPFLERIPLINKDAAEIFGRALGKGTNIPLYGEFIVQEFEPGNSYTLSRNSYFGKVASNSNIDSIVFRKYKGAAERMKAIRSGAIWIIVLPSDEEIHDAASDPTLATVASPFQGRTYGVPEDVLSDLQFKGLHPDKIIIRNILEPSKHFQETFSLSQLLKKNY